MVGEPIKFQTTYGYHDTSVKGVLRDTKDKEWTWVEKDSERLLQFSITETKRMFQF